MPRRKGLSTPVMLSLLSGVLLIISGTRGSIGVYGIIISVLALFLEDALLLLILKAVAFVLIFFASLGGVSVVLGGYLIYKSRVRLGKFLIGLGAGVGIPGLLLTLFTLIVSKDFSAVIAQRGVIGWTGVFLSLIARATAR